MSVPSRGLLLVDLENMVGQRAKPKIVAARLDVLVERAGPDVAVIAACAKSRITPQSAQVLRDRGIKLLNVGESKDAADEALLAEAHRAASESNCRRFVVASNDSRFAELADLGDLEVLIWQTQKPRKNYTARAVRVERLPMPGSVQEPGPGAAQPTEPSVVRLRRTPPTGRPPAAATVTQAEQAGAAPRRGCVEVVVGPQGPAAHDAVDDVADGPRRATWAPPASASIVTAPRVAAAGLAVLAAGAILGAGFAAGDVVARRLLRGLGSQR